MSTSGPTPVSASWRRRALLAIGLAGVTAAAYFAYDAWQRDMAFANPPELDLTSVDPAVQESIRLAAEAVRKSRHSADAWGKLGMILFNHKFAEPALACLVNAERLQDDDMRWPYHQALILMADDPPSALPKMIRATELAGESQDRPRLRLAELYLQLGRFDDGRRELESLWQRAPGHPRVNLSLARALAQAGELDQCRQRLPAALRHPLTRKAALRLSAEVHQRQGNHQSAQADLAEALATLLPDDPDWPDEILDETQLLAVGEARDIKQANQLLDQQLPREAAALLQRVVRSYPQSVQAWQLLGYAQMNLRQFSEAEESLRTALKLSPHAASTLLNLGTLDELRKDRRAAIDWYRKAIELKPDSLQAHLRLGACLKELGDRPAAIGAFQVALRCQPLHAQAHGQLGALLLQENRVAEALTHLQQAVALNPNDAGSRKLLEGIRKSPSTSKNP